MTIAEKINTERRDEFKEFDLDAFDSFVEDRIRQFSHVTIGIEFDSRFESGSVKQGRQLRETQSKWLAFSGGYKCYVWNTDCQIPQKFVNQIVAHLNEQGLRTSLCGACGYSTYDVIKVTL